MRPRHDSSHVLYLLCLAALLLLSSCAAPSVTPQKMSVRTTSEPVTQADDLIVLVDACIVMDRLKDYISIEDSRKIESYMASAITSYFENIGYQVERCCTPFVGSFKAAEETFAVKEMRKDKAADIRPPFFIEEVASKDKACQEAFARIIRAVLSDVEQKEKSLGDVFKAKETIREDVKLLQEHLQKRYVLVVIGNGKSVPGLTSFAQGMATGMATGLLTGGLLIVTASNVTYLDTYAAIIDLSEGELLWANSMRMQGGKVCSEDFYSTWNEKLHTYDGWVQQAFFHVPVKTPVIIEAAKNGDNDRLGWMLVTGADPSGGDNDRMTGLHWACRNKHLKTLQLLTKHKADVNSQDINGDTPLHYAVRSNQSNMIRPLLKMKADVHVKNTQGESPLDLASSQRSTKIAKMLRKYAKR